MKKTEKDFDCVEMKRAGALRLHETIKDMSAEEEREYWKRRNQGFRKRFPRMRWADKPGASED